MLNTFYAQRFFGKLNEDITEFPELFDNPDFEMQHLLKSLNVNAEFLNNIFISEELKNEILEILYMQKNTDQAPIVKFDKNRTIISVTYKQKDKEGTIVFTKNQIVIFKENIKREIDTEFPQTAHQKIAKSYIIAEDNTPIKRIANFITVDLEVRRINCQSRFIYISQAKENKPLEEVKISFETNKLDDNTFNQYYELFLDGEEIKDYMDNLTTHLEQNNIRMKIIYSNLEDTHVKRKK